MFCRSINWLVCTLVAAAIATDFIGKEGESYTSVPDPKVRIHHLTTDNPELSTAEPALKNKGSTGMGLGVGEGAMVTLVARDSRLVAHSSVALAARSPESPAQTRDLPPDVKGRRLMVAAQQGAVGQLEALLAAGADVGATDEKRRTALHWVAWEGHVEAARRLLAAGAAVNARDRWQLTPLHWAAMGGHAAVVRLLLAAGADQTARSDARNTPLHVAAARGHTEAAAALLEGGTDTEARDRWGRTPLDIAKKNNHQQLVELLQRRSPAPAKRGPSSYPATQRHRNHSDHQAPPTGAPTMVAQTITETDDDHITLLGSLTQDEKDKRLIEAAKQGAVGELQALLAAGADVGARDEKWMWNETALHWAAAEGHVEASRRLVAAGAAVDARDNLQQTPLHEAAMWGHAAVVRLLLAANADHSARDSGGNTPLHWAAGIAATEAAAALLEAGADRAARNNKGDAPLDIATSLNHHELLDLLQRSSSAPQGSGTSPYPATQPHSNHSSRQITATTAPTKATQTITETDDDHLSLLRSPAAEGSGTSSYHATQLHTNHSGRQTPATAASNTAAQTITETDDDHISLLRSLPPDEKSRRLVKAAEEGAMGELESLLEAGADVAARDGGPWNSTALHYAAWEGHVEAARRLVEAGAPVDARDSWQLWTPLHEAALWGHAAVVRLLLAANADHSAKDSGGNTPLHWVAGTGHTEAAAALLEGGASRGARDRWGRTPLDLARENNHQQLVELLQWSSPATAVSGISPYSATQPHSNLSYHQTPATTAPKTDDDQISLLRRISPDRKGRRLIEAAKQGAVGELEALLVAGADVGARDRGEWNMTALHYAADKGHVEAARRLLAAGAAVDARDIWQWTPLHYAAGRGHAAVVRLLLANNADHGARTDTGMTPLHWAAFKDHTEAAAALLEAGADRGARNGFGATALDIARFQNNQQLLDLLQQK